MLHRSSLNRAMLAVGVALFAASAFTQAQFFDAQPAGKSSTLIDKDKAKITDAEFASWAKGLLIKNGETNARDAKFMFAQCFSGGMLDDLKSGLGDKVSWVGGSAARHDESSWGQSDGTPNALDWWVKALLPEVPKNQSLIDGLNNARANDSRGPNGTKKENPQSIYQNGGQNITLKDPNAKSHHAVLWAGYADGERHINDIKQMYAAVKAAWAGLPGVTFTVLGDKAKLGLPNDANLTVKDATKANLKQTFEDLNSVMNKDEQFLFFSSNHGGLQDKMLVNPVLIQPLLVDPEILRLNAKTLFAMQETRDNVPTFRVEGEWIGDYSTDDALELYIGGTFISRITRNSSSSLVDVEFEFDENLLSKRLISDGSTSGDLFSDTEILLKSLSSLATFRLDQKTFFTGSVNNSIEAVPEPMTMIVLGAGLVAFARRRQR